MEPTSIIGLLSSGMMFDMTVGMAIGMIASPLMMKGIKAIKHRRKLDRLFHEIAEARKINSANIAFNV